MPTADDRERWCRWAARAESVCETARHDPYAAQLADAMRTLAAELEGLRAGEPDDDVPLEAEDREVHARAHVVAGEAWFALNDNQHVPL